ncbi:hypothetical protein TIFTF001_001521 [Ficus carica]|uniref:Uncharacterized protein n=1 Tax=Ficus carica TaxID=3494 RepID=A0AA88CMB5_FICCA|nr:hypothetical protein TIFTF001_001521 [Ficus carica]
MLDLRLVSVVDEYGGMRSGIGVENSQKPTRAKIAVELNLAPPSRPTRDGDSDCREESRALMAGLSSPAMVISLPLLQIYDEDKNKRMGERENREWGDYRS